MSGGPVSHRQPQMMIAPVTMEMVVKKLNVSEHFNICARAKSLTNYPPRSMSYKQQSNSLRIYKELQKFLIPC